MRLSVVTLFPEMFRTATDSGVLGRAVTAGVVQLGLFNPRDYTSDRHRTVDDRPYGGGPGMVMMVEPLLAAIDAAKAACLEQAGAAAGPTLPPRVIYLSPQGRRLDQAKVRALAAEPGLVLVAGRYEGIDERVVESAVDEEISIGDYVLTGGELPAMVLLDALSRHLPGTLGNQASSVEESHLDGLLDYPHYTRPENVGGKAVPAVLLTGDHGAITRWRRQQAFWRTWQRRPDMLIGREWSDEDRELFAKLLEKNFA
ncbi:MAG: tRNA (guanosine(37)-N1)-methyltransferase TrmD [Pseudomonadales bacterium]